MTEHGLPRVGFIGLGVMGRPMAERILRTGAPLTVWSRSRQPIDELCSRGARGATSAGEVASGSDVVICMLPDTSDVIDVLTGTGGVFDSLDRRGLVIDMSTISPVETAKLATAAAAQGLDFVDAPVSGGEVGAVTGTLSIMVGGSNAAVDRARPLLQILGKSVKHVGGAGAGQTAKACNQLIVGMNILAVAEALALASSLGVEASVVRDAIGGGFASSRVLELHGERMLHEQYEPGFRTSLHLKDARIVLDSARASGLALPGFEAVVEGLEYLVRTNRGNLDHAALKLYVTRSPDDQ